MINDNRYWVPDLQHYIPTVCVYYVPHFSPSYVVILLYIYTPDLLHFLYIPYTVCLYGLLSVHLYNVTCFLNYLCIPILHTVCNAPLPPFSPYHFTLANVHIYSIIYIPFCFHIYLYVLSFFLLIFTGTYTPLFSYSCLPTGTVYSFSIYYSSANVTPLHFVWYGINGI